ncbi:phage tail protein [Escherichia coli]
MPVSHNLCIFLNVGLGEGSALPVGVPVPWPLETPPTGWLKCNGAAFSSEKHPKLAKAYPELKLPDLRGEFIRGWDDGRGVDSGRTILSVQGDALQDHGHKAIRLRFIGEGGGNVAIPDGSAEFTGDSDLINKISGRAFNGGVPRVSGETRPRNIAFNYIVRAA